MASSQDKHSNPISRAFSKFFERGDVSRKDAHPSATPTPAPRQVMPQQATTRATAATPAAQTAASPSPAHAASTQSATTSAAPSTVAPGAAAATSTATPTQPRTYTVKPGDSLSKIAQQVYGRADRWQLIFEANRATVRDADLIHPGQVLVLPDASTLH
ncbi:MAG TPA: LysM peptidoglycan-binding domain-containing protein [Lysobacter sp.]|nr:LysM peptidoglycan-binding domain-containing protein [Lysobacter sp.]